MSRKNQQVVGVNRAADFLYSIMDEFKPADDLAARALKEARLLLDITVERLLSAHEWNVRAALALHRKPRR